jgi:hypothetical protein
MKSEPIMRSVSASYKLGRSLAPLTSAGRAWTRSRDLPAAPRQTFRAWYEQHGGYRTPIRRTDGIAPLAPPSSPAAAVDPPIGSDHGLGPIERFGQRLQELGPRGETELHIFSHATDAQQFLRLRVSEHPSDAVVIEGERSEKKDYALGITSAAVWIADTAGLVLDLGTRVHGRAATLVDTHIAVANSSRYVGTLEAALKQRTVRRAAGTWGDFQVIVTGPSRTADIEKVLVIPAHGPRRLIVVMCDEDVDFGALR